MIAQIKKLIATFFYVGYLPLIPGTFGSIAGLFIYIGLAENPYLLIPVHFLIIILGFLLAGEVAKLFNRRDPPQIVIDEINGMLISFLGLPVLQAGPVRYLFSGGAGIPIDKFILISGFVIFRILDAVKPYPANRLQRCQGSLGIMGDDIVAGIYTNLILRLTIFFLR